MHIADIRDIQWTERHLLSAGIDNYLIVSVLSYQDNFYSMVVCKRLTLHEGWVTGISVHDTWMVSQGSDLTCKVWTYPEFELAFVLKYNTENFDLVKKPCCGKLIALAGCSSGVTGHPCLTMIDPTNWQVFEIHLESVSKEVKRPEFRTFGTVKCSVFCGNKLFVGTSEGVFCVEIPSLCILWHEKLDLQIFVKVI